MNGIEKITGRITGDADREIAELLKKARDDADAALQAYDAEADATSRDILGRGKAQAKERALRLAGVADLEARKMILAAKQEMLEKTFSKAMDDLTGLPEDKYVGLLASLAAEAAVDGRGEVIFSQADRTRIGKKVVSAAAELLNKRGMTPDITLSEETRPITGGLLLKNGDIEINCSFEAVMRSVRDDLTKEVADILFA